jgi:hypothetical protein
MKKRVLTCKAQTRTLKKSKTNFTELKELTHPLMGVAGPIKGYSRFLNPRILKPIWELWHNHVPPNRPGALRWRRYYLFWCYRIFGGSARERSGFLSMLTELNQPAQN